MDCSNVKDLGCFSSCEDIQLPSEVLFNSSDTNVRISYLLNGAMIRYDNDYFGISNVILDSTKLNEDYSYLIHVHSTDLAINNNVKDFCFKFKILPLS